MIDSTQLIEKLKQGAINKCRERVLAAATNKKSTERVEYAPIQRGFTSRLREGHGL